MRLNQVFRRCFTASVDGRRRVKLLEIFGSFLSVKNPRHLAALRRSGRENSESVETGGFGDKHKSGAEKSEAIAIHPLVSSWCQSLSCGRVGWGGGRTAGKAELCIHRAASGRSAKCARLRRTGGAKFRKREARSRPRGTVAQLRLEHELSLRRLSPPSREDGRQLLVRVRTPAFGFYHKNPLAQNQGPSRFSLLKFLDVSLGSSETLNDHCN